MSLADWTLALAGGEGTRLADYVLRRFGRRIPKQYCALLGDRSMLQDTLDRTLALTPASRTLTAIGVGHAPIACPQLVGLSDHVFRQPASRDTGVAIYAALAMIKRRDPDAIVTITPTDHYVAPAAQYIEQLRTAQSLAARAPERILVLGVAPTELDPELGYLLPAGPLAEIPAARCVRGFVEKPSTARAHELSQQGALWNTMVMCASVSALWSLGYAAKPHLMHLIDDVVPMIDTPAEGASLDQLYQIAPPVNFSRDVLEASPERLAVLALDGVEWSDWGRAERIEAVLTTRAVALPRSVQV